MGTENPEHAAPGSGLQVERASPLLAEAEARDGCPVALDVLLAQVGEQPAALPNHLEEATAGVVILPIAAEVVRQEVDPLGQERNLHLGRAGIGLVRAKPLDDFLLLFGEQRHCGG